MEQLLATCNIEAEYTVACVLWCGPRKDFYRRIPYKVIDHKLGYVAHTKLCADSDVAEEFYTFISRFRI